jgi:RNA polymerase sigma-70 factor (ECF subfamily)
MPVQTAPEPEDQRARRAFDGAIERLLGRWRTLLDGLARRHLLDVGDMAEIEQDVRIRLWRHLQREGGTVPTSSYVYAAVRSAVFDRLRRRRMGARGRVALDEIPDGVAAPSDGLDADRVAAALERALGQLAPDRRLAVRLHLDGRTLDEIVALLGWSAGRARNLLYRGLDDLRAALRREEP